MDKEKILEQRNKWYNFIPAKLEIIKCLKTKELSFLDDKSEEVRHHTRYLIAHHSVYLDKHFKRFDVLKTLRNLYHSVAELKDIPMFSYNLYERRKEEEYQEFNKNYKNYVVGYEFYCDFDGKENFKKCYEELVKTKKIFDDYKIPYYIVTSSFTGFHLCIPAQYMPSLEIDKLLEQINSVLYNLKGIYNLECLDISVGDIKRVKKLPYSCVCDGSVALPLSDEQIKNYTSEMIAIENVMKKVILKNRGLLIRNHGLSEEKLKENVSNFIKDFL